MKTMENPPAFTPQEYRWLLREMWLGCDGRWFLNVADRYGYEVANELNKVVNRSLAKSAMKKIMKVKGWGPPANVEELKKAIETGYEVYHPSPECEVELNTRDTWTLEALFYKCPVMSKVEKGGGMHNYLCACPLSFEAWIEALGLRGEAIITKGPEQGSPCRVRITVK